ncbi:MAG: hypothetical protein HOK65_03840 [Crocinitomicaceae bacterium]|jgi:hypothetical protein|nr:hypothetical protein [Crocinitomicaceae bacterium]
MKKLIYFSSVILLISCGDENAEKINQMTLALEDLKTENIKVINESVKKDSMINAYALYVNEIHQNLDLITTEQGLINTLRQKGELGKMATESEVIDNIKTISDLMAKNASRVARLKKDLKNANIEMDEFEKMIITITEEVAIKNQEIYRLEEELANIDGAYQELFVVLDEKQELIDQQVAEINQVWYAIGSSKELKNNGVITKEGGLLGIGRTNKLKADFNHDYFTEINLTDVREIVLGGKSAEMLTAHSSESYTIEGSEGIAEKLIIKDEKDFWSASKYLVIVLK